MRKATKLYALLGVLLVVCIAAFAVSRYEEKKEQIKNSGEVILEIPTDSVTALSWTNESGTFSFTKDETWVYDDDNAFPVDEEKINDLLEQFTSFAAAFAIDDVEDYAQYGLDEPICTIHITAGEESYTVELGDFSKMDEQRYVSIGDGKVYLVSHDPLDEFDSVLRDMILDDTIPEFDTAKQIAFTGSENYTISYDEETKSICADDVYFTDGKPLDTAVITEWLTSLHELDLTNYVSYNVTDEELETFGLDEPALAIIAELPLTDAEALEIVDRRVQHGVHRLEAVRALHGVHIPVIGDDLRVNISLALVLLDPRQQARAVEVGDPIQAVRHVHDDHIVDDLAVFVQRGGVFRAPDGDLGNVADINFLQDFQCVLAGDLHQIMRPAVEAYTLADGLGVGACDFIFSE